MWTLILVLFLSSQSVITTTNISSVRIWLRQSNSNSKRPTPTVRCIRSFIDERRWHDCIVSWISIQLSGWIILPDCDIRSRFSNDNNLQYECAAFVCLYQICNWENMILSGKWSWCQWHDYKWKYTIASDSESGTFRGNFITAAEQNASILARTNKGNTALMEVLRQHVFAAAPFWSTCQML